MMKITTQDLAGVKDAVKCFWEGGLCNEVKVKTLTKKQILRLLKERGGWTTANATPFYHNQVNYARLKELLAEGKVKIRDCSGYAFELAE